MHLVNGAIKKHLSVRHNSIINRENLVNNTEILRKHSDNFRIIVHEALLVTFKNPLLNRQDTGNTRILQLYTQLERHYIYLQCYIISKFISFCIVMIPRPPQLI